MSTKILRVTGSMDPASGGICQAIKNTGYEMLSVGVVCEVVCIDDPNSSFLVSENLVVHALGPAKTPWQFAEKLMPWLMDNLGRFDVCIIDGLWIYPGYAAAKAVRLLTKRQKVETSVNVPKIFVMPHGMLDPYFQKASGRKFKAIRNWAYWKLFESKIVNRASAVLFTCETELQLAQSSFKPYHPKKEINIGLGITPPPAFVSEMTNLFLKKMAGVLPTPYFLFLGRINEKKGVDLLIECYIAIFEEAHKNKIKIPALVIAGPGVDTPFGKKITNIVNESDGAKNSVFFPGMLNGTEKWGALYGCDAFILPSHQENFGVAVVEAMACAKAVLISDQINIATEINTGGGAIVAPDTLQGTNELLCKWLNLSSKEQQEMGENALLTFHKNFNIKSVAPILLETIKTQTDQLT